MTEQGGQVFILLFPYVAIIIAGAILGTIGEICDHLEKSCSAPDRVDPPYNPFASHAVGENHAQPHQRSSPPHRQ